MSEEEQLGKLAYDAYCQSKYNRPALFVPWDMQPAMWRKDWIIAAKAVAERVLAELQASVEQSE